MCEDGRTVILLTSGAAVSTVVITWSCSGDWKGVGDWKGEGLQSAL